VLRLPFPAGTFGGVVDALTSQHLPWADHGACFREYRRVLRPGGWLFLMHLDDRTVSRLTPLLGDGLPLSGRGTLALFPNAPAVTLTPHWSLCDALLRAGFRLVAQRGLAREYYDHDSQVAHYTVLMAEAA
jgi:SAM-dependent methyltransferase